MQGRERKIHLVGVAGVGMSALAQALRLQGYAVSGSDRAHDAAQNEDVIHKLRCAGVAMAPQDGSGVTPGTECVVVSTAIEGDNADLRAAAAAGVPVRHRAEMLAELVAGKRGIAITGTSGKTTVTGLIGWLLQELGADPAVVNGGELINWCAADRLGNVRAGRSDCWVFEADESDRSLLRFHPDWAVITNMSADHFDAAETIRIFEEFRGQVRCGVVDPLCPDGSFRPRLERTTSTFAYGGCEFRVPVPGAHNAENALQAILLCERLGYPLGRVAAALATFRGIRRRLEVVVEVRGVAVIDDYAHNPAKIEAAWRTLAPFYERLRVLWRPHGFRPLAQMREALTALFARLCRPEDRLVLLPVYFAGGTAQRSVTSAEFAYDLAARGVPVQYVASYAAAEGCLCDAAAPGTAIVCMGARDPELPVCARRVAARLQGLAGLAGEDGKSAF